LANLGNENCIGSPYGNHNLDCKDCYLLFASFKNERVHYSRGAVILKDCLDMYNSSNGELCYENNYSEVIYKTHFSYVAVESLNSSFLTHSKNLQDCICCINLRSKSHCIFNKEYSKQDYEIKKSELDFGSYRVLSDFERKYSRF